MRSPAQLLFPSLLGLALVACDRDAAQTLTGAVEATRSANTAALRTLVHPNYIDGVGEGGDLIAALRAFNEAHPVKSFTATVTALTFEGASRRRAKAELSVDGRWGGKPSFHLLGRMPVVLERWGPMRIRSGWLTALRDVDQLVAGWRAFRRAPEPAAARMLLHPRYEDGFDRRDDAVDCLMRLPSKSVQPTLVRLELREDLAHLDLHEEVGEAPTAKRPQTHRWTLRSVAGRWRIAAGVDCGSPEGGEIDERDATGPDRSGSQSL